MKYRIGIVTMLTILAPAAVAEVTAEVGGRIHLDATLYDEDVTELGSGSEFRRLRFYIAGDLAPDWTYKFQVEVSGGDTDAQDAYARYSGFDFGTVTLGNLKVPFSLEELMSSRYITFIERASINAFAPSRRIGAHVSAVRGDFTWAASVYGDEPSERDTDEGLGAAARVTYSPPVGANGRLHLGAAVLAEEPVSTDAASDTVRFRARPESHVTNVRLIDTGTIGDVSVTAKYGLEAAALFGSLSLQAEYIGTRTDAALADVDFDGYYAYASWLTGGHTRAYRDGVFKRTKAENAWEFGLRYSHMSLDDGPINGGEQDVITLAANYYVNPYLRFMANYSMVDVSGGIAGDEDPSSLTFRVSFDFE
ncbi:MAG: OprO/OprP family phosphate-selective porin [Pseudomonadota bacterium]